MSVTNLSPALADLIAALPRCAECDRPMRPWSASRHDWPGTVSRGRSGICGSDSERQRREHGPVTINPDAPVRRRKPGRISSVPDFIPVPVPDGWQERAACASDMTNLWFSDHPDDISDARNICRACPVRDACLTAAMAEEGAVSHRHGIRGGYTGRERRQMYRRAADRERRTA